jgi:hypothetical protein
MAKVAEEKITYRDGETGLIGHTKTFVTVGEMKYGSEYDYPALRLSDLTEAGRTHLVAFFKDDESAEKALEFGPRNRLAGVVASQIRTALVAPSTKTIRTRLQELVCKMIGSGDVAGATELAQRTETADTSGLQTLWEEFIKKSA